MKTKILKLLSHKIDLIYDDPGEYSDNRVGRANEKDLKINVSCKMPLDNQNSVLVHEVLHLVADMLDVELEEKDVERLAIGLFSFIRENRKLIEDFWKDDKKKKS